MRKQRQKQHRTPLTPSIVSGAVAGSMFYLFRLSQGSEVVWDRHGDWRPWDKIKQDQNVSNDQKKWT